MKIIVTGSLGNVGKPLTQELVQKGHQVTVISSNAEKTKSIEDLGAVAAIGSLNDLDFLVNTFKDADIVYSMVPPANYFDHSLDLLGYYQKLGNNYAKAIEQNAIKKVINLSTIGGNLNNGNGILLGAHHVENILNNLSADVAITHIRPTEFYYNLLPQIHSAKNNGFIGSNIGKDVVNSWVSPVDIAAAIVDEIENGISGRNVRYVASDELTYTELARILGAAIGKEDLKWVQFTDEEMQNGLVEMGIQPKIAVGLTEMYSAIHTGFLYEDYKANKPKEMGKIQLKDFAKDFANAYNSL
ncbi:NAD(P)H-binding protein [Flavobacterium sp. Fl-77]|uniref:NAD(P)H-binding protein n=1 Tax=Flavobacterium flavipigmentatum TaxID=2893884 RepID=A0AAJ2S6Q6_9FLAO|nr:MULTISPECIES: NAD(P)H-binding protein [unclassified Flavobacterium]MDX6182534.1 NAD(P)H-binding protein [Flavobacterium sp. Fl-33]MDX6185553.1 NAD(P)H-binding protein [Flavobacterium sp. Fl-77]UFH38743.1 NAD(P)H-binding protein [Flavobacterium sp. F-70]